jgi:hypothetical protein
LAWCIVCRHPGLGMIRHPFRVVTFGSHLCRDKSNGMAHRFKSQQVQLNAFVSPRCWTSLEDDLAGWLVRFFLIIMVLCSTRPSRFGKILSYFIVMIFCPTDPAGSTQCLCFPVALVSSHGSIDYLSMTPPLPLPSVGTYAQLMSL